MTKYTYSEWIEHDGKGMPVDKNTIVRVRTGDDWEEPLDGVLWTAGHWGVDLESSNWTCQDYNPNAAIVAYQIAMPIKEPVYTSVDAMVRNPDDWEDEDD